MAFVALMARRVVRVDGVERQVGEVFELTPIRAAAAIGTHGHALTWAKDQPKAQSPKPKARTRRKRVAEAVHA